MSLCQCGCGNPAPVYNQTHLARGIVSGQPARFIRGHHLKEHMRTRRVENGYRGEQHVRIAERVLGRTLPAGAEVHHVDGDKRNNAHRNLVICQDTTYHRLLHIRAAVLAAGGDPNTQRLCGGCRTVKPFDAFCKATRKRALGRQSQCRECMRMHHKRWTQERRKKPRTEAA